MFDNELSNNPSPLSAVFLGLRDFKELFKMASNFFWNLTPELKYETSK